MYPVQDCCGLSNRSDVCTCCGVILETTGFRKANKTNNYAIISMSKVYSLVENVPYISEAFLLLFLFFA